MILPPNVPVDHACDVVERMSVIGVSNGMYFEIT